MKNQKEDWTRIIREYEASGLTATRFCQEQELRIYKFRYWQKRMSVIGAKANKFLQIYPEVQKEENTELIFPNGMRVMISSETDFGLIKKLEELFRC